MIVLFIFAVIASVAFSRELGRRGYQSASAVRLPLVAALVAILLSWLTAWLAPLLLGSFGITADMVRWLCWLADFFYVALVMATVGKNWAAIKRLPHRQPSSPASSPSPEK